MHISSRCVRAAGIWAALLFSTATASAQLQTQIVAQGFTQPVVIAPDPLVPGAMIVVQQNGLALAVLNGVTQSPPFLDLRAVVKVGGEQGLLGLAFSTDGHRIFVNFTRKRTPDNGVGDTVVARFRRSANPLVLDSSSRFDLVWPGGQRFIQQPYSNHKGGNVAFGADGYLYIGLGDGGSGNDPENSAQRPDTLLGKMLRIDVSVPDNHATGYVVPTNNPFFGRTDVFNEIWAFGYRNPWRYSFDDFGAGATGALIVGDVGQGAREEIDYEPFGRSGRNYGWSIREGRINTPGITAPPPAYQPLTEPIWDYGRSIGTTVIGGYVYRGSRLPAAYRGRYFFADTGTGRIFSLGLAIGATGEATVVDTAEHTNELSNSCCVVSLGRGVDGELYLATYGGTILKIVSDGPPPPAPPALPAPPANLGFSVNGSTVTLGWQAGAGGGTPSTYQIEVGSAPNESDLLIAHTASTGAVATGVPNGLYFVRVRARNAGGASGPSNEITVGVGCVDPAPAPADFAAQVNGQFVALTWRGVPGASGYQLEAGSRSGLADLAVIPAGGIGAAGLVPPGVYHARVRAVNGCGAGLASNEIIVTVP